jgi:hypothetical protein
MDNRGPARLLMLSLAGIAVATPAIARDKPKTPSLAIEPIGARDLLSHAEPRTHRSPSYRLNPPGDFATGERARLSVDVGDTTLFAITGRLDRRDRGQALGPLDRPHGAALTGRKRESSRVYGAGAQRRIGPVDLSATYQYSKVNAERSQSDLNLANPRSHSVRATARIRFKP